jgi:hypothetical protein
MPAVGLAEVLRCDDALGDGVTAALPIVGYPAAMELGV